MIYNPRYSIQFLFVLLLSRLAHSKNLVLLSVSLSHISRTVISQGLRLMSYLAWSQAPLRKDSTLLWSWCSYWVNFDTAWDCHFLTLWRTSPFLNLIICLKNFTNFNYVFEHRKWVYNSLSSVQNCWIPFSCWTTSHDLSCSHRNLLMHQSSSSVLSHL